jgi:hypothetical protein
MVPERDSGAGHAGPVDDESEGRAIRRREIGERLVDIRARINDLERTQQEPWAWRADLS